VILKINLISHDDDSINFYNKNLIYLFLACLMVWMDGTLWDCANLQGHFLNERLGIVELHEHCLRLLLKMFGFGHFWFEFVEEFRPDFGGGRGKNGDEKEQGEDGQKFGHLLSELFLNILFDYLTLSEVMGANCIDIYANIYPLPRGPFSSPFYSNIANQIQNTSSLNP
jgi:hypothetical protein